MNKVSKDFSENMLNIYGVIYNLNDKLWTFLHVLLLSWIQRPICSECPGPTAEYEQCTGAGWELLTGQLIKISERLHER